ncbi:MAG: helix-turn-helix domain-containing protein [Limisphaerales bacterium]
MTKSALVIAENAGPHQRLSYTRTAAARLLGISPNSLDRLVRRGLLRPSRALRRPLFSISELERFLAETT